RPDRPPPMPLWPGSMPAREARQGECWISWPQAVAPRSQWATPYQLVTDIGVAELNFRDEGIHESGQRGLERPRSRGEVGGAREAGNVDVSGAVHLQPTGCPIVPASAEVRRVFELGGVGAQLHDESVAGEAEAERSVATPAEYGLDGIIGYREVGGGGHAGGVRVPSLVHRDSLGE